MDTTTIRCGLTDIDVETFSATEVKTQFGDMLDRAARQGLVGISKHDRTRVFLISKEQLDRLNAQIPDPLTPLREHFEGMMTEMQQPVHRTAVDALFRATTEQLGTAALEAARNSAPAVEQRKRK